MKKDIIIGIGIITLGIVLQQLLENTGYTFFSAIAIGFGIGFFFKAFKKKRSKKHRKIKN